MFSYQAIASQYDELFRHLLTLVPNRDGVPVRTVDMPTYFDSFRHFATAVIDENTRLVCGSTSCEALPMLLNVARSNVDGLRILNSDAIGVILAHAHRLAQGGQTFTVNELVSVCDETNATVKRHVMFLVKHGYLFPADGASQPHR